MQRKITYYVDKIKPGQKISGFLKEKGYSEQNLVNLKKNLKSMQQGNFSNDDIMKAKITYMNSIKELEDNPQNLLSLYTGMEYLKSDNIDNRIRKISKVKKKDVMKLASKIHLDVIYFLQGGEDNEN